jgi:hypothetical protein
VPSRQTQTTHVESANPGHADVAAAMYEMPR